MLWFFDVEVFKENWVAVFINPFDRCEKVFVDDVPALKKFYEEHKNDIFAGFNVRQYDQYILKGLLLGFNPKDVSDWIIVKDKMGWQYSDLFRNININIYDCMVGFHGLKTLQGFMGDDIRESKVDFNLVRKLTPAEIAETLDYCRNDVLSTIKVFLKQKEEFDAHGALIKTFNLPLNMISKTKAQLSAEILGAKRQRRDDEWDIEYPNTLRLNKYQYIKRWYDNNRDYDKSLEIDVAGVPHIFAWGGLHGARNNYKSTGEFLNIDVASYYPSLMLRYGWESRNCTSGDKFKQIYETRLKLKREGKKKEQQPYKIVLNSTYGAMKDKHNNLYDPRQANNVCVGGQLLLLDLIEKLEDYCDLIQANTDGILIKLRNNREHIERICHEWEHRTGMVLEYDEYVKVLQKDVNNYILIDKYGNYKSKGAYVKKLNDLDYNLPIVNEAVVNYFVRNIPIEQTVNNCHDLKKFQQIVKVTGNYDHAVHGCKKLKEKTLRIFASADITDRGIFKVKNGRPEKFADTPLNVFIVNGDVNSLKVPNKIDRDYYIALAKKRVKQFLGN